MGISNTMFRAGYAGSCSVDGSEFAMQEWSTTWRGADLDTTNFESNGYEEGLIGVQGVDWTVNGDWDASQNPLEDPPGLYPRVAGEAMILTTNTTDAQNWDFPQFRVHSSQLSVRTSGKVSINASGKNNGTFTPPTGSV